MILAKSFAITASGLLFVTTLAHGDIQVSLLESSAPPRTILGVPMTPAIPDPAAIFADVVAAPLAAGKSVSFSSPVSHRRVGAGWATWSHGYTGDVYYAPAPSHITMTFSQPDLTAFYFYIEAETFGSFTATISAAGTGGASTTSSAIGDGSGGAVGFGIVATGSTRLTSVTITSLKFAGAVEVGYAFGEFGWAKAVPAPGAGALLVMAGFNRRRRPA